MTNLPGTVAERAKAHTEEDTPEDKPSRLFPTLATLAFVFAALTFAVVVLDRLSPPEPATATASVSAINPEELALLNENQAEFQAAIEARLQAVAAEAIGEHNVAVDLDLTDAPAVGRWAQFAAVGDQGTVELYNQWAEARELPEWLSLGQVRNTARRSCQVINAGGSYSTVLALNIFEYGAAAGKDATLAIGATEIAVVAGCPQVAPLGLTEIPEEWADALYS